jgi:hypothetical protein
VKNYFELTAVAEGKHLRNSIVYYRLTHVDGDPNDEYNKKLTIQKSDSSGESVVWSWREKEGELRGSSDYAGVVFEWPPL